MDAMNKTNGMKRKNKKRKIKKTKEVTNYYEQIINKDNNKKKMLGELSINTPILKVLLEIVVAYCSYSQCQGILTSKIRNQKVRGLQFKYPNCIAADNENIYISDLGNVQVMNKSGKSSREIFRVTREFKFVQSMIIHNSYLYITDPLNYHIKIFSLSNGDRQEKLISEINCGNLCIGINIHDSDIYTCICREAKIVSYSIHQNYKLNKTWSFKSKLLTNEKVSQFSIINADVYICTSLDRILCFTTDGYFNHEFKICGSEVHNIGHVKLYNDYMYINDNKFIWKLDSQGIIYDTWKCSNTLNRRYPSDHYTKIEDFTFLDNKCYVLMSDGIKIFQ